MNIFPCPICNYPMDETPSAWNYCPCCGTQFGYHDSGRSHSQLRQEWIATGMRWWSPIRLAPKGWNSNVQLFRRDLSGISDFTKTAQDAVEPFLQSNCLQPWGKYPIGQGQWLNMENTQQANLDPNLKSHLQRTQIMLIWNPVYGILRLFSDNYTEILGIRTWIGTLKLRCRGCRRNYFLTS